MSRFFPWLAVLVGTVYVLGGGCKDDLSGPGTEGIVFPDSNVSYLKHVQPLFDRGCAFSGCHGPDTFDDAGFSLDSYQNATNRSDIIVPRNPDGSILVRRIEGTTAGVRMPLTRPPLTDNQIRGIRRWILEGAQLN